jgi:secreted protein with Ig-like and vWFA domain
MGTRSTIALEFADGTVEQVYCHWDGYLEHNGRILFENYTDPFKLRDLIDMGGISSLGKVIGQKHPFGPDWNEKDLVKRAAVETEFQAAREAGYTTFYARDRGEDVTKEQFVDFQDYLVHHQYEEYEYILRRDGNWYVKCHDAAYVKLAEALVSVKEIA